MTNYRKLILCHFSKKLMWTCIFLVSNLATKSHISYHFLITFFCFLFIFLFLLFYNDYSLPLDQNTNKLFLWYMWDMDSNPLFAEILIVEQLETQYSFCTMIVIFYMSWWIIMFWFIKKKSLIIFFFGNFLCTYPGQTRVKKKKKWYP